jgi:putative membrane protein
MKAFGILAFVAGIVLAGFLIFRAGFAPVAHALATLGVTGLLTVIAAHIPIIALLGAAWWTIAPRLDRPRLLLFAWARAVRDAAAEALPFSQLGGYVIGGRALSLAGADAKSAGLSTFLDLVLEFAAKIPYLLLGLLILEMVKPSHATIATILVIVALAILLPALRFGTNLSIADLTKRLVSRWPRLAMSHQTFVGTLQQMESNRPALASSVALHLLCWVLGAGETWLIFHFMHAPVAIVPALAIDSLVGAIRTASFFVPGAIGTQEGGYVLLCGIFGLSPSTALAFSFARRGRDIVMAIPVLLSWQWREGQALLPGTFKS